MSNDREPSARPSRVCLVRHAHAVWSEDEQRPLSPSGALAALALAERLASLPITAIYSSTSRRAIDTVAPLANRLRISIVTDADLRERELPPVSDFDAAVRGSWQFPETAPSGGESNRAAQSRGVAVIRRILAQHTGEEVVVATHGTLLTLILNDFDPSIGYEFWQRLSFPDIVRATFAGDRLVAADRVWETALSD